MSVDQQIDLDILPLNPIHLNYFLMLPANLQEP